MFISIYQFHSSIYICGYTYCLYNLSDLFCNIKYWHFIKHIYNYYSLIFRLDACASSAAISCTTSSRWCSSSCGWSPSPGGSSDTRYAYAMLVSTNQSRIYAATVQWQARTNIRSLLFKVGPSTLTRVLGDDIMVNFRKALGDNDEIYDVSSGY